MQQFPCHQQMQHLQATAATAAFGADPSGLQSISTFPPH